MGKQIRITAPTPEGAILLLLDVCKPADIAAAVDLFIERLDQMAGDPDLETNGDELDGSFAEDDFCDHNLAYPGPGCPVSDGGCPTGSGAGDPAWAEWHTRGRHKVGKFGEEQCRRLDGINMAQEDDEDDDPRERNGDERDTGDAEDDELSAAAWLAAHDQHDGPGCYIADTPEPSMGALEACAGRWPANMGSTLDEEPWRVPVTLNAPMAANDSVPA